MQVTSDILNNLPLYLFFGPSHPHLNILLHQPRLLLLLFFGWRRFFASLHTVSDILVAEIVFSFKVAFFFFNYFCSHSDSSNSMIVCFADN
ncbi:hypothetical protein WN944_000834 [Citrus x changshan-huyou]|uniref:Uncharacterized protein n=1 Tax=Citrus x changshan-huyou TaxID=2935761 RepID=A0AAP0MFA8_9ROSI